MKILIDSTWFAIYTWENGRKDKQLLSFYGPYNAPAFTQLVEKILTPSQFAKYVGGDHDYIYDISRKRQEIMEAAISLLKQKNQIN